MSNARPSSRALLLVAIALLGALPACIWFEHEADRQADAALRNLANLLPAGYTHPAPNEDVLVDRDLSIQTWDRERRPRYALPREGGQLALQPPGFTTVESGGKEWRVYSVGREDGFVQVASASAPALAARAVAPAILLSSVVALVCGVIVGRSSRSGAGEPTVGTDSSAAAAPGQSAPERAPRDDADRGLEARIERTLAAQRDFLGDAAHELRSPLTALKLQLQLARRTDTEEARESAFEKVFERLDRCIRLVNQLLTLSRHEAHFVRTAPVPVDLVESARVVVADQLTQAEARGIDLGIDGPETPVVVDGYPDGVRVMLGNLVDNALRYTPAGGQVDVAIVSGDSGVSVAVRDTGPGIPAESRARVFDRFYRIAGNKEPGSGLGLAIVKSIAEYHGASVTLDDAPPPGGLEVRIDFPGRG